jgi:hypothetical protein
MGSDNMFQWIENNLSLIIVTAAAGVIFNLFLQIRDHIMRTNDLLNGIWERLAKESERSDLDRTQMIRLLNRIIVETNTTNTGIHSVITNLEKIRDNQNNAEAKHKL